MKRAAAPLFSEEQIRAGVEEMAAGIASASRRPDIAAWILVGAFVFAAEEDFGISPVEAQACGTPVIAFRKGGALETVIDGETGLFFDEQTAESLMEAVHRFESQPDVFDPLTIRTSAERFRAERFQREFLQVLRDARQQFERRDPF